MTQEQKNIQEKLREIDWGKVKEDLTGLHGTKEEFDKFCQKKGYTFMVNN